MRITSLVLFVRAFRGDAEAARLLMKNSQPPVVLQKLLTRKRNVEVQSIVAKYTRFLSRLVFSFETEKDLDRFEELCVRSEGNWHRHMFEQAFRAQVVKSTRPEVHEYSL